MNILNDAIYDVIIVGGGTSGCACAYNASKLGLKTLLVEKNNFLGGLMTGGLVVPVMKSSTNDLNCDYYKELVKCAKKYNAQITYSDSNDGWFHPEILKIVLDDILSLPNLDILYETNVKKVEFENKIVNKIYLSTNLEEYSIHAKYFVDATGSGEFSKLLNCDFINDKKNIQQNSLRFIISNVNVEKFSKFILSYDSDRNITNTYRDDLKTNNKIHFTTASTWDNLKHWAIDTILQKGVEDKILEPQDRAYFQLFSIAGGINQVAFNCPRIDNYNDNPILYSIELKKARQAIWRIYNFCKKYFLGFEDSFISNIATTTGIREQTRVKTRYIYKKSDMIKNKHFRNPVLYADYGIDIHSKDKNSSVLQKVGKYCLPIESLISYNYDNLFVIGKLVGAEFEAHSALRVQKSCMSMGEAVAKYISNL